MDSMPIAVRVADFAPFIVAPPGIDHRRGFSSFQAPCCAGRESKPIRPIACSGVVTLLSKSNAAIGKALLDFIIVSRTRKRQHVFSTVQEVLTVGRSVSRTW